MGFDVLDFGSFVSPKAIPQLRDTAEVLAGLDLSQTKTKLLAIVANLRGAEQGRQLPRNQLPGLSAFGERNLPAAQYQPEHQPRPWPT